MECSKCGSNIPDITSICPNCGDRMSLALKISDLEMKRLPKRVAMDDIGLLVLIFALFAGVIVGIITKRIWLGIFVFFIFLAVFIYNHMTIRIKLKLEGKPSFLFRNKQDLK